MGNRKDSCLAIILAKSCSKLKHLGSRLCVSKYLYNSKETKVSPSQYFCISSDHISHLSSYLSAPSKFIFFTFNLSPHAPNECLPLYLRGNMRKFLLHQQALAQAKELYLLLMCHLFCNFSLI